MNIKAVIAALALTAAVAQAGEVPAPPEVKVTRTGTTATLTFPEGTIPGSVGWRIHDQTVTAKQIRKGAKGAMRWTSPTEVTVDLARFHRRGHIQHHDAQGAPEMEMWIWGQLTDGTQLLQKQTVR